MTDPNFLHAGDHVHLGPGVTGTRLTNPAVELGDLPNIDVVLLSHYHADHFDELVENSLRRDLPIVTTPHAKEHLSGKGNGEAFTAVHAVEFWEDLLIETTNAGEKKRPAVKVTGMPGKHVPDGILGTMNDFVRAVPPTNGWMLELGYSTSASSDASSTEAASEDFTCGYRIYISGDTLLVSDLAQIPEHYTHAGKPIDLMLIHLGGTTIPGPSMPLLMVTMDAKQGVELVKLIRPDLTIPVHYDDYDVFLSPLEDFRKEVEEAGLKEKVVYLDRGEEYKFDVRGGV
jgi:L-ascorbate metabolism protein UlaG (beta-lactamase superfamily)